MDFGRQRGFLLDGEDLPEKVGCRKESYFLEFMYVDVARDFVGVVLHVLLDGVKGSYNHRDCCCFEPPHSLNLDFQVFVFVKLFRGFDDDDDDFCKLIPCETTLKTCYSEDS